MQPRQKESNLPKDSDVTIQMGGASANNTDVVEENKDLLQIWREWVRSNPNPVILDGGLGSELERRGIKFSGDGMWSGTVMVTDPNMVRLTTFQKYSSFSYCTKIRLLLLKHF